MLRELDRTKIGNCIQGGAEILIREIQRAVVNGAVFVHIRTIRFRIATGLQILEELPDLFRRVPYV